MSNEFDSQRDGTGTHEWAEVTENIARGCPNNCLYCYAASNANRFKLRNRDEWQQEALTKRAFITSYPAKDGVIMFPSSHDITPFNVDAYIRVATLMLEAGNRLLIVSKPNPECIPKLLTAFSEYKDKILFRFSIGSTSNAICAFWEPGAPTPHERIHCLKMAFDAGFRTSVSAEPLLGGLPTARDVLRAVRPFVTDTVWIGKMNKVRARVDQTVAINRALCEVIERDHSDDAIMGMYEALNSDPIVRWKDSIVKVAERHKGAC